jgi:hypothetical protein
MGKRRHECHGDTPAPGILGAAGSGRGAGNLRPLRVSALGVQPYRAHREIEALIPPDTRRRDLLIHAAFGFYAGVVFCWICAIAVCFYRAYRLYRFYH